MMLLTLMTLERREEAESWDRGVGGSVSVSWPRSSTMLSPLSITTLLTRLITSPSSVQTAWPSHPAPAQRGLTLSQTKSHVM